MVKNYLLILVGIIAASFAAIFIKIASDAPALIIAAYRLVIATAIMSPYAVRRIRHQRRRYSRTLLLWNILSGIALALHFATWIASLKYTSVARSVILVAMNPLFVAILGWLFLKEKLTVPVISGIVISIAGTVVMSLQGSMPEQVGFTGDALALSGAFFAAIYFLIGRHIRQSVSTAVYSYATYGIAAIVLVLIALFAGLSWTGYEPTTYLMFLLLALIPQIIGHTSLNYALRDVATVIVAIAILGEPIAASVLARILLNEPILIQTVYGGILILIGVFITVYFQEKRGET